MTFSDFKSTIEAKKQNDTRIPKNDKEYRVLIQESIEHIALTTIPIDLVDADLHSSVLRWLSSTTFIRVPNKPSLDTDKIDIDEQLSYAVIYDLLSRLTKDMNDKQIWERDRDNVITNYEWNNYKFLEKLKGV